MLKRPVVTAVLLQIFLQFLAAGALAQSGLIDGMRGPTAIADESKPPPLGNPENKDVRRERTYTMQPPTIPHKIDNYQVDKNVNMCLNCHSRGKAASTQAVAVSVSHYMDRDGNFLAAVSPRRYFCEQCHVAQFDAKPLVENRFEDVDEVIQRNAAKGSAKKK
jgi:cytochrome c-type protein NapB